MAEYDDNPEERLVNQAEEFMRQGRYQDAIGRYEEICSMSPSDAMLRLLMPVLWNVPVMCNKLKKSSTIPPRLTAIIEMFIAFSIYFLSAAKIIIVPY